MGGALNCNWMLQESNRIATEIIGMKQTQTVLYEAPYSLASLYYTHVQHKQSATVDRENFAVKKTLRLIPTAKI